MFILKIWNANIIKYKVNRATFVAKYYESMIITVTGRVKLTGDTIRIIA